MCEEKKDEGNRKDMMTVDRKSKMTVEMKSKLETG